MRELERMSITALSLLLVSGTAFGQPTDAEKYFFGETLEPGVSAPVVEIEEEAAEEEVVEELVEQDSEELLYYGLKPLLRVEDDGTYVEFSVSGFFTETSGDPNQGAGQTVNDRGGRVSVSLRPVSSENTESLFLSDGHEQLELGVYTQLDGYRYQTETHKGHKLNSAFGIELFGAHVDVDTQGKQQVSMTLTARVGLSLHRDVNESYGSAPSYKLLYQNSVGFHSQLVLGLYRPPAARILTQVEVTGTLVQHLGEKMNDTFSRAGTDRDPDQVSMLSLEGTVRLLSLGKRFLTLDASVGVSEKRANQFFYRTGASDALRSNEKVQTAWFSTTVTVHLYGGWHAFASYKIEAETDAGTDLSRGEAGIALYW